VTAERFNAARGVIRDAVAQIRSGIEVDAVDSLIAASTM